MTPRAIPLPVSALLRRARNAKSAKDRHDTAYFAWEASVILAVAARPPADPSGLARPSVGTWVAAADLSGSRHAEPPLLAVAQLFAREGQGRAATPSSVSPREVLDGLPAYRNQVIGHGSTRDREFYEAACPVLMAGLEAAWGAGFFLHEEERLTYVDALEVDASGAHRARLLDLTGEVGHVVDPDGTPDVPETLLPQRVYVRRGGTYRSLHPFVLVQESEARERVYLFSSLTRRARFLDYVSGETLAGDALEAAFPGTEAALLGILRCRAPSAAAPGVPETERFGDYRILGKLGEGGMGVVYLARQESLGRLVALKMLPEDLASDPVAVARFDREVSALSRCEHPNVVKVLGSGVVRGQRYYAMEYVEGADIARVLLALRRSRDLTRAVSTAWQRLRAERKEIFGDAPTPDVPVPTVQRRGRGEVRVMARALRDAARGLAHLHAHGIVHRDVKPANLMLTAVDRRIVVMDLGLAAVTGASRSITKDKGLILGTLRYMAPEQLQRNLLTVDHRADIFSLGATFYELMTGRPLRDGDTEARLIEQILHGRPPPAQRLNPRLPGDLSTILGKALEHDPKARYASAEELAADVDRFLEGRPISARPPTLRYVLLLAMRRNRPLAATAAVSLLLLVLGTFVFVRGLDARRREAEREREEKARALVEREQTLETARELIGVMRDVGLASGVLQTDDPLLAERWLGVSGILLAAGDPQAARPLLEQALGVTQTRFGPDHPNLVSLHVTLGRCCRDLGAPQEARLHAEEALRIAALTPDDAHPDLAAATTELAVQILEDGGVDEALSLAERARALLAGVEPLPVDVSIDLGRVFLAAREPLLARRLLDAAITGSAEDEASAPRTARALVILASVYEHEGELEQAREALLRSQTLLSRAVLRDDVALAETTCRLGDVEAKLGDVEAGVETLRAGLDLLAGSLERRLPGLRPAERWRLADRIRPSLSAWLEVCPLAGESGYAEVLRFKGMGRQAEAQERRLQRGAPPGMRDRVAALHAIESELARLANSAPSPVARDQRPSWLRAYADASRERDRLAVGLQLGLRARSEGTPSSDMAIEVDDVRAALGPREVLVDVLRVGERYLAWIVQRHAEPVRIDMGPGPAIDADCEAFRDQVGDVGGEAAPGLHEVAARLRAATIGAWERVWGHEIDTLYLCADGALGAVPLQALPGRDAGRFVLDDLLLVCLGAAGDVVRPVTTVPPAPDAVLVGDVDHDLGGESRESSGPPAQRGPRFVSLPGTRAEIEAIAKQLGSGAIVLTGADARERVLRKAAAGAAVLHLAAHGVARTDLAAGLQRSGGRAALRHDPLAISVIALAGSNTRDDGDGNDGLLSGLELAELDLGACRLVVLSFCDGARGFDVLGEGARSLVEAAQMAGADTVVASLLKVDDEATRTLMVRFYEHLLRGAAPAVALREAALWLRDEAGGGEDGARRFSAPRHWAGFVCYGR